MAYRKNKVICPWCGAEKGIGWFSDLSRLTSLEHRPEHVDTTCDSCGRRFEVRAEECVYYKTRKVGE